jgi:hypothetical protein
MPQPNTHKLRKDEALRRHKERKERLYQQKQQQQQQQPPARPTQQPRATQQPQQSQQPARQPTVILPDYTERAQKLGELIALNLRGNWNWNDGIQMARQYAPNGTTEAELRAAVMHAAKLQGNTGNLYLRALVQPEVLHPQVNISDLPQQSPLQNVARGLQAPLRSVAAGATQLAGKVNPHGQYGKESGGKPFRAPQSFAEAYASDPTYGSALELAFPNTPQWFRVLLGGALDFALDPMNLLGAKALGVAKIGELTRNTRAGQILTNPLRVVPKPVGYALETATENISERARAVGTRVMHPTAAKTLVQQVPAEERVRFLSKLGESMERVPVYSFTRNVGGDMQALRNKLDNIIRRANEQGINIPKSHNILDFEKYIDEIKQENISGETIRTVNQLLKQDLNQLGQIETQIRAVNPELADEVQKLKSAVYEQSDAWLRQANRIDKNWWYDYDSPEYKPIKQSMWEGARAVFRREILPSAGILSQVLNAWKRSKTIYNLATHTRNALQNFLFRYLTGDVDVADLLRLPQAVRDLIRFRKMMGDTEVLGGNIRIGDLPDRHKDFSTLSYILGYQLNREALMKLLHQVNPNQVVARPTIDVNDLLRLFPSGDIAIWREPEQVLDIATSPNDKIRAGILAHETGIPISQLPRNWLDVILFPFRRATEITREVRAKEQPRWRKPLDWLHTTAQRAYNAGDLIPALLMEITRRRKTVMSGKPFQVYDPASSKFRMDYSSVPETIGMANIALLPFVNYQYFAVRALREALRKNPERVYNVIVKPIERSTRITQADDEHGVSQSTRFGFAEREMYPVSPTRGIPYSSILPMDVQFAEPLVSLSGWASRSPITAIVRPFVENRDDSVRMVNQVVREFTPASITHTLYALMGEPQRGLLPALQHTRGERLLRAIGINIQPIDQMRIAKQQQRTAEQQRTQPLWEDPATITGIVNRILRNLGW